MLITLRGVAERRHKKTGLDLLNSALYNIYNYLLLKQFIVISFKWFFVYKVE
jgi:hypothetical protein